MSNPLATARQLWRLNKEGYLTLWNPEHSCPLAPISSNEADLAIKALGSDAVDSVDSLEAARAQHS
jgi:hypothetical protein